ncbi:hypothetical protein HMI54_000711 [Coelomomyces lativittatus]|nr:hypothetical protein HMI56_001078 [Coelomomyces lativittatus]KAJ1516510.1 hypothetical protein HMI55_002100 [Coelomomyces lativittatus]KAJ1518454.1 hypothetical protein HMI54_000711 [Coelomomyces lativittatus]
MPSNTIEMRGLSTFITDLRNCRSIEQEEKRVNKELGHIRQKFKVGNLSGYDRKKYVSKLLYMFILGYKIDFGQVEAVNLIASSKFKEKQMGYLAVTLFINESMDAIHLVINSFKKDLDVELEHVNCLVLHAIANIGGAVLADSLGTDVYKKLMTSTSPFVQKKAALCLLKLYRKSPDMIFPLHTALDWLSSLYRLIQQAPLDVVLAITTLCTDIAKDHPSLFEQWIPWVLASLNNLLLLHSITEKEMYYRVPTPWLVIKLFHFLRIIAPTATSLSPSKQDSLSPLILMDQWIQVLFNNAKDAFSKKNMQHINAITAVLVEALQVLVLWNPASNHWSTLIVFIAKELAPRALHLRYIAMEVYRTMLNQNIQTYEIRTQESFIRQACHDRDISIRHQAIDVLYAMCDADLGKLVITTFIEQLKTAEPELKQVLVSKISSLAEKFHSDFQSYFQIMCELVPNAGEAGHRIWYTIVHQALREKGKNLEAVIQLALKTLETTTHETLIQLCVYLISEHVELIRTTSIEEVFQWILNAFHQSSDSMKPLFLTCFLKLVKHVPSFKDTIALLFQQYATHIDIELQERAHFYLILLHSTPSTLQKVCEPIPPLSLKNIPVTTSPIQPSSPLILLNPNTQTSPSTLLPLHVEDTPEISTLVSKSQLSKFYFSHEGVLFENASLQLGAHLRVVPLEGKVECMVYVGNRSSSQDLELSFQVSKPDGVEVHVQPSLLRVGKLVQERMLVTLHVTLPPLTTPMYLECTGSISVTVVLPIFSMQFNKCPSHLDSSSVSQLQHQWTSWPPQPVMTFPWVALHRFQDKLKQLRIGVVISTDEFFLITSITFPNFQSMVLAKCKISNKNCLVEVRSEHPKLHSSFLDVIEATIQLCNESKEDASALLDLF